jgi:hypothetical protein
MAETTKTITEDELATLVLRVAWAGLRARRGGNPERLERANEYYVERLRNAKALADVRGLIAELVAEGGPIAELGTAGLAVFWQYLERDFRKCRDIALMTSATDENIMALPNQPVPITGHIEGSVHFEIVPLEGWTAETVLAALNDGRAKWEPENRAITLLGSDKPIAKMGHQWPSHIQGQWLA